MNDFLDYLAERKYSLYHALYIAIPQAYTEEECYDRIVRKARYLEVLQLINNLPIGQRKLVEDRFEEMKG